MLNDALLGELARQYGTPSYIFDESALEERIAAVREIFGADIRLCYSIKANPFLIPAALGKLDRLEVCSPGELDICKALGVPGGDIVYSGVYKSPENCDEAVTYLGTGAGIYTAESRGQLQFLEDAARRQNLTIPVLLRLNSGAQFGMSKEDLIYLISNRASYPHVRLEGVHYFVGTQRKNKGLHKQIEELEMLHGLFEEVRRDLGFRLQKLEYGPGLPVPLFEGDDFSDTLAPAKELAPVLQSVCAWAELTVEMGRFLATECGYYLTKVVDQKSADGKNYAITDGGINHVNYLGQIMGMKVPVIRHLKVEPEKSGAEALCEDTKTYAICGSLCTTNDDLVRSVEMRGLATGDVLAFTNIGAYSVTEGIYLFLSRTMPRIVLYNKNSGPLLVRDFTETSPLNTIHS